MRLGLGILTLKLDSYHTMSIRTAIVSSILAIAILGLALFFYIQHAPLSEEKMATYSAFRFEIADSEAERVQGLSGRSDVPPGSGLLFIFDRPERYGFWMKDMLIPIDIFWLDANKQVISLKENALPERYPESYAPSASALYVLETRSGFAREHRITVGTTLSVQDFAFLD